MSDSQHACSDSNGGPSDSKREGVESVEPAEGNESAERTEANQRTVWCVRHRDGWCATKAGRRPTTDAIHDETRCGHTVHLRTGSGRRLPNCAGCRSRMRLATKETP